MKRKIVAMLLTAAMTLSLLAGCGQKEAQVSSEGKKEESTQVSAQEKSTEAEAQPTEKKEITVLILERGKCSADEGTMEQNRWTEWINENSPVKVKWIAVPRTESVAKTNALFASDSAPDLVWEFGKSFMDNLYLQGVIQPVDDYIEQYSTEYKAYLEEHQELVPYLTEDDGQMYAFSSARSPLTIVNHGMWIRQDWLDNLGLDMPTTVEELYEVALAFTKDDPDGNGVDDTYGVTFNYNGFSIMQTLFGKPEKDIVIEDDTVSLWTGSEGYRQCYTMLKNMYENGIIDPEYVTDTNYERQTQLLTTGKAGIYLASYDISANWRALKENCPEANLVPMESVAAPDGNVYGLYQEPAPFRTVCMNANAKDPEACIQFLDWMLTEGWYTLTYGIEGEHYNLVNGVPQTIDEDKNNAELAYAYEYPTLMDQQIDDLDTYLKTTAATDDLSQEYAGLKAQSIELALKNEYNRDVPYQPTLDELTQYNTESGTTIGSIQTQMITDPEYSIDQGMEELEKTMKTAGLESALKALQEWYDANKELLN